MQEASHKPLEHNPVIFYIRSLLTVYFSLALRLVYLSPLLFLFLSPDGSPLRWLALLCPVLLIFLLLPLRFSFAQAIVQKPPRLYFSLDTAFSLSHYPQKLKAGLAYLLHILLWTIPLIAVLGYAYYSYQLGTDAITLLSSITRLGQWALDAYQAVVGFFGQAASLPKADIMTGAFVILGILGLCGLVLLYGILRNSATRYLWAMAARDNLTPKTLVRERLKNRRILQILLGLLNLLLLVPFLFQLRRILVPLLSELSFESLLSMSGELISPIKLAGIFGPLLFAFFALYLPLVPLRRMVTAYFATKQLPVHTSTASRVEMEDTSQNELPQEEPSSSPFTGDE